MDADLHSLNFLFCRSFWFRCYFLLLIVTCFQFFMSSRRGKGWERHLTPPSPRSRRGGRRGGGLARFDPFYRDWALVLVDFRRGRGRGKAGSAKRRGWGRKVEGQDD